jgi:hypothetical protein
MGSWPLYVLLGLVAGVLSGIIGIGGGVIIVPVLVFLFGLSQHQAQGTTLALLVPPIGILAAWTYYKAGYVNLEIAAFVCVGFVLGGITGCCAREGLRRGPSANLPQDDLRPVKRTLYPDTSSDESAVCPIALMHYAREMPLLKGQRCEFFT